MKHNDFVSVQNLYESVHTGSDSTPFLNQVLDALEKEEREISHYFSYDPDIRVARDPQVNEFIDEVLEDYHLTHEIIAKHEKLGDLVTVIAQARLIRSRIDD